MSNPFHDSLEKLRGRLVQATGTNGETYRGWVERIHHHDRHVVLRDAVRVHDDGSTESVGTAFVAHADTMFEAAPDPTRGHVARVDLDAIDPSPYALTEWDAAANRGYINKVREDGWVGSFPVVRVVDGADGQRYELVEGHKRVWVARQAGLETHPVEIVDVDDWAAARRFAADHLPTLDELDADGEPPSGYYDQREAHAALLQLLEEWGDRALEDDRIASAAAWVDLAGEGQDEPEPEPDQEVHRQPEPVVERVDDAPVEPLQYEQRTTDTEPVDAPLSDHNLTDLEREVVDALATHGEQSASELQLVTGQAGSIYSRLRSLVEKDLVEQRQDPDDGRRKLYSLTTQDVDEVHDVDSLDDDGDVTCGDCGDTFGSRVELAGHQNTPHTGCGDTEDEGDSDGEADSGGEPARAWCGYCGQGPFPDAVHVETHHDREDHPGDPVPVDEDPGDDVVSEVDDQQETPPRRGRRLGRSNRRRWGRARVDAGRAGRRPRPDRVARLERVGEYRGGVCELRVAADQGLRSGVRSRGPPDRPRLSQLRGQGPRRRRRPAPSRRQHPRGGE